VSLRHASENAGNQIESPALWNPNAAANWSLMFTPAFGAYLHMLNWRAMGEEQRAAASMKWFLVGIALLLVYAVVGIAMPDSVAADSLTRVLPFIFLMSWYFGSARAQAKAVRERFGSNYTKKSWGKPLGIAVLGVLGFFLAIFVLALILALLTESAY
jgi:hypothetical protein